MHHQQWIQEQFDNITETHFNKPPKGLYEPIRYIMSLGGKRMRPLLVVYGHELFGGDAEQVLTNAYGIELFHNFTLVHDDIMDAAKLRRGEPAVHIKYGLNAGILSGDMMMVQSLQMAAQREDGTIDSALFALVSKTAREIYEGQQMDIDFESRNDVLADEYIEMIRLKTAVLLGCSLQVGAMLAGASSSAAERVYRFGEDLGIAFQIRDDYLDSFGDAKVGKRIGGDILNNKKTLLLIKALEMASDSDKENLEHWLTTRDGGQEKIDAVLGIYERSGAKEFAHSTMLKYHASALDILGEIEASEKAQKPLIDLARVIVERNY